MLDPMLGSTMHRLAGIGAIVTGAASGIGAATAAAFDREGATTLLVDLDGDGLERTVSALGPRASACVVDLRSETAIPVVLERAQDVLPALDVLVNDAGVSSKTPFLEVTEAEWDLVLGVNAFAAARLADACGREMVARGSGRILNVSSISGLGGGPAQSVYGISKGALLGLTRELWRRLAPHGVRVNAVLPGVIDTPMVRRDVAEGGDPDLAELRRWISEAVPVGRIGRAEEVASVLAFLASADGAGIDGAFVPVEGGFLSA
jgi:NAD(P)-dependent dehydrogenase (short-subunit alcohol dehydrogenase family)